MPVTEYIWDDVNDCVLEETDELGATQATYTHEPAPFGPLVSEYRGGTTSTHHYDALGSTTMLTNDAGTVTDTFQHDAWGNQVARTGMTPTPYTWVGRVGYQDDSATTGGYYVRARIYQPAVARWLSMDPYLDILTLSTFQYVGNQSAIAIDASGLIKFTSNTSQRPRTEIEAGPCPLWVSHVAFIRPVYSAKWTQSPDEKGLRFSQRVTVEIEITTSCSESAFKCGTPEADQAKCCNNRYVYYAVFYEQRTNEDQQPCTLDKAVLARAVNKCRRWNECCSYAYQSTITKELTAKKNLKALGRLLILKEATFQCCKQKVEKDLAPPDPANMPTQGQGPEDQNLRHIGPYEHELWVNEKTIQVEHPKCGDAKYSCSRTSYEKH